MFVGQIIKQFLIKPHITQLIAPGLRHSIITTKTKRMCKICYARISDNSGRIEAQNKTKKVFTQCDGVQAANV